ncbi:DMT family transporter [Clostridium sp. OF09-36]|uniref:DMT family transporter n=1 Tax=Clostridium sp. OF09-36 TaxID=2292310 RepID=UPI00325B7EA4
MISCVQFFTAGVIASVPMLLFDHPTWSAIVAAAAPILYAGVMSCGVGYTLQVVAQNGVDPTVASLLLSLESVFSVLAGWIILGQKLSGRELFGCVLVFAAVLLVQIPTEKLFKVK